MKRVFSAVHKEVARDFTKDTASSYSNRYRLRFELATCRDLKFTAMNIQVMSSGCDAVEDLAASIFTSP
jgi:regulator of PEP synthase PpsR (kinase-PPPase family)